MIAEETIRTIGTVFPLPIDTTLDKMVYGPREQVSAHPDARIIADAAHAVVWNKITDAIRHDTRPLDQRNWVIIDVGGKRGTATYVSDLLKSLGHGRKRYNTVFFYSIRLDGDHYDHEAVAEWGHDVPGFTLPYPEGDTATVRFSHAVMSW